jgi:hypothetical protein
MSLRGISRCRPLAGGRLLALVAMAGLGLLPGLVRAQSGGTQVYRFANEPFVHTQCYHLTDPFPGPATTFGQDVCVTYNARNSATVRIHGADVDWSLIQIGTATVVATNGTVLESGQFRVEEQGRDDGGDAGCRTPDNHAFLGACTAPYTALDFMKYHWKIQGASVYFYDFRVRGPGQYCTTSKQGGSVGTAC